MTSRVLQIGRSLAQGFLLVAAIFVFLVYLNQNTGPAWDPIPEQKDVVHAVPSSEKLSGNLLTSNPKKQLLVDCILHSVEPQNFWSQLVHLINNCSSKYTVAKESLFTLHVGRYGETKQFLGYTNPEASKRCRSLTIGIGGDYNVEKELLDRYPECRLFGLDPKQAEGWEFINFGTYIPYGLTKMGGMLNLTVRKPGGSYGVESVPTLNADQLIRYYTGGKPIHFATLDIEGGEYFLLPEFEMGGSMTSAGLKVCQLDVEFHGPLKDMRVNSAEAFHSFLANFLKNTGYVPVAAKAHLTIHRKITLVDIETLVCQELFRTNRIWK